MISYMLVLHCKPLGPIIREIDTLKVHYVGYFGTPWMSLNGSPHLTLKEGSKVKSDNIRRFAAHDFLYVGFTLQTSRTNNKGDRHFESPLCGLLRHSMDELELRASRSNVCKVVEDIYICYTYHL